MYNDGRDYTRWETYSNWTNRWFGITNTSDHWPWNKEKDMIKKHPQGRAERMIINAKKNKRKRKDFEEVPVKSDGTISSDIATRTKDN